MNVVQRLPYVQVPLLAASEVAAAAAACTHDGVRLVFQYREPGWDWVNEISSQCPAESEDSGACPVDIALVTAAPVCVCVYTAAVVDRAVLERLSSRCWSPAELPKQSPPPPPSPPSSPHVEVMIRFQRLARSEQVL